MMFMNLKAVKASVHINVQVTRMLSARGASVNILAIMPLPAPFH
jgi:hypothetical protein